MYGRLIIVYVVLLSLFWTYKNFYFDGGINKNEILCLKLYMFNDGNNLPQISL